MSKKILSLLALILVVILWGIAPVISKYLFDNNLYSPALLVAIRGLLSCFAMFFVILVTGGFKKLSKSYWVCVPIGVISCLAFVASLSVVPGLDTMIRGIAALLLLVLFLLLLGKSKEEVKQSYWICILAGLILGAAYLLQFIGLDSTTPAKNTFLESFSCIAVPICMFLLVREKPTLVTIIASLACVFGSFVLCGNGWDFTALFSSPTSGDILSCIGGLFFGIDIAFTKVFAKNKDSWVYVFIQLIVLTVMSFAYAIPFEHNLHFSWQWQHILILIFLGVACTAVCWVLRTISIKNVSAVTCAVLMPMSAVVATLTSIIFHMEEFSWNVVAGGIIITLSIILSGVYDAKMEKKNKELVTEGVTHE